eukprot:27579-Pyramimonas_sp.AAC.1
MPLIFLKVVIFSRMVAVFTGRNQERPEQGGVFVRSMMMVTSCSGSKARCRPPSTRQHQQLNTSE